MPDVHVLGELPVPQILVVFITPLEVEAQLGGGVRVPGREQGDLVATRHQLVAHQRHQLLDGLSDSPTHRRSSWGDLRDPQRPFAAPRATAHRER